MLFNSLDFAFFLPIVFVCYWIFGKHSLKFQNIILVVASYIFYGWWDWRFLSLIFLSTLVDYTIGLQLEKVTKNLQRKALLISSIIINLGILGSFKYYNFFIENMVSAFSFFGNEIEINALRFVLPIGISFYTFQTLSYTIDVYHRKIKPTKNFIVFSAFVCFFPQLVAGPIERAKNLLPQFLSKRKFNYDKAVNGLRQILWGLFKKIVIADNCARFANQVFDNYSEMNSSALILGALFFAFQIYGDFSGYSDIAIGTSRLFGFNLMKNFAFPYFSRDIAEFWRRWHISLSTWFRDYLYIPLGGSKGSTLKKLRNVLIVFIVSGFWHGANWTFIFWGAINALFFLPLLLLNQNRRNLNIVASEKKYPSLINFLNIVLTFSIVCFAWIFFRAENLNQAFDYIYRLVINVAFEIPNLDGLYNALTVSILAIIFIVIEWIGRRDEFAIENIGLGWNTLKRHLFYYLILFSIFWFGTTDQAFIYFQF
jgi:D-alanyl-lipoteichoic acid acyltransferase DltB (MBOAT superfamily)